VLTPVDIEDRLNNLDHRLDRIEQILPTLATKKDLEAFATKEDLRVALQDYPTKADLTDALGQAFELAQKNARILHEDLVEKIKLLGEQRRRRR
jgi:hypothetical protein